MVKQNNQLLNVSGDNIIIEHMRLYRGLSSPTGGNGSCVVVSGSNIYFRHCAFAWADDEIFTIWQGGPNITLQYCMIYEALGFGHQWEDAEFKFHPKSMITGVPAVERPGGILGLTLAHCVFLHADERQPILSHLDEVEIINCIVYGWQNSNAGGKILGYPLSVAANDNKLIKHNVRGVIWMNGVDETTGTPFTVERTNPADQPYVYVDGNMWQNGVFPAPTRTEDPAVYLFRGDQNLSDTLMVFSTPPPVAVTVFPWEDAWRHMKPRIGAILPARSRTDARIVDQIDNAINQVSLDGWIIDNPTGDDVNQNPSARGRTAYARWDQVL